MKYCANDVAKANAIAFNAPSILDWERGATMDIRGFAAITAMSLFAGCAIHPVPEDVTGLDTADIVKQIRCETRDAARQIILKELERLATYGDNTTAQNLLSQYTEDRELMSDFNPNRSFSGPENIQVRNFFNL